MTNSRRASAGAAPDPTIVSAPRLRRVAPADAPSQRGPVVPEESLPAIARIVSGVRDGGMVALRQYAEWWDRLPAGAPLLKSKADLQAALRSLRPSERELLERTAARIERFARAQLDTASPAHAAVPGGTAGDRLTPVRVAGCYAPGGRFPLSSSALMTTVTARVAGVEEVWLASPDPSRQMLATAAIAGVDGVLAAGGAQAMAAMAYGVEVPRCDVLAGPGNHWVTGAKMLLVGAVGVDSLAGASELVVLSDEAGDPKLIAADLLAQAEHDDVALPVLVTTSASLAARVDEELAKQLPALETAETAAAALANGFAVVATEREALRCCQELAPEHLEIHGGRADRWAGELDAYGAAFVGEASAEVLGDYGLGPNHVLPTGGSARFAGGLSVFSFLRRSTWVRVEPGPELDDAARDAAALARMEGLAAHARAAEMRISEG